jgi:predicted RNA-binding protein Jag
LEQENERKRDRKWHGRRPETDPKAQEVIQKAEELLLNSMDPAIIKDLSGFQRKLVHEHFERSQEYSVKAYRDDEQVILKIYPVGRLKRLAEQKTQEVLMKGIAEVLPPMGSYQRFVIHDYLKERDGVKTVSTGEEGKDRHIEIHPIYGRSLKKAKSRLTR